MLKRVGSILGVIFWTILIQPVFACDVCRKNQPKILQDITHGTGSEGNLDYLIIWSAVLIVTVTLLLSVRYLIRPGENQSGHIKNIVLEKR
jgi:hypothetical protein